MTSSLWGVWGDVANHLVRMALAFLFTLPIAWNRERGSRSAGLRTFPIVALASCGFVLLAIEVLGERSIGQARILEGVITGIGFIGGGAILKAGTTTHDPRHRDRSEHPKHRRGRRCRRLWLLRHRLSTRACKLSRYLRAWQTEAGRRKQRPEAGRIVFQIPAT